MSIRESIRFRLLFYTLLCSSLITLVITSLQLYLDYKNEVNFIEDRFALIENSYVVPLSHSVWNFDENAANVQLAGMLTLPDLVYAKVVQDDELLISQGREPENRQFLVTHDYALAYPIEGRAMALGTLTVVANLESIYVRLFDRMLVILGSQGVKTFLTSAFFLFIVQLLVTRHLTSIANYANSLMHTNMQSTLKLNRAVRHPEDELESLCNAINHMRVSALQDWQRQHCLVQLAQRLAAVNDPLSVMKCALSYLLDKLALTPQSRADVYFRGIHLSAKNVRTEAVYDQLVLQPIVDADSLSDCYVRSDVMLPPQLATTDGAQQTEIDIDRSEVRLICRDEGQLMFCIHLEDVDAELLCDSREQELFPTLMQYLLLKLRNVQATQFLESKVKEKANKLQAVIDALIEKNNDFQQAQKQLVHSEKMSSLGTLVAGAAHEIGNPNNFISVSASNLLNDLLNVQQFIYELAEGEAEVQAEFDLHFTKLYQHLALITEGTERISKLVNGLRNFSRFDKSEIAPTHLSGALESTLRLVKSAYSAIIEFRLDLQSDPEILANEDQMSQVFMNLLVNACQSIEEKRKGLQSVKAFNGLIQISSRTEGQNFVIEITDNGLGMTAKQQAKAFEPFFTTKPVGQGTGLGLSISYQIIQGHSGTLQCHSNPGEGVTFTLSLPISSL